MGKGRRLRKLSELRKLRELREAPVFSNQCSVTSKIRKSKKFVPDIKFLSYWVGEVEASDPYPINSKED